MHAQALRPPKNPGVYPRMHQVRSHRTAQHSAAHAPSGSVQPLAGTLIVMLAQVEPVVGWDTTAVPPGMPVGLYVNSVCAKTRPEVLKYARGAQATRWQTLRNKARPFHAG
mgnify:CR=1 FL=1